MVVSAKGQISVFLIFILQKKIGYFFKNAASSLQMEQ